MEEHIAYLVLCVGRPFSYRDFLDFEARGGKHGMSHGTFRNKIGLLRQSGVVELDYNSGIAFYTLKNHRFGKSMTPNHTVVKNSPIYETIRNLPLDKQCIHDIRMTFHHERIWQIFSEYGKFDKTNRSQDITIPPLLKSNVILRITIHKSDTVSIVVGCSLRPISLDTIGIIRFFSLLAYAEGRMQSIIDYLTQTSEQDLHPVPEYRTWIVTMWHFSRDGSIEYAGKKFSLAIRDFENVVTRLYSKDFGRKTRIRIERQELPNKSLEQLIKERLYFP